MTNTATATGTDAYHSPVTSNQSTATVPARGTTSSLSLTKSALTSSYSVPGQTLNYNYLVTNTGTTTISSIAVSDNVIASVSCPDASLAPGDSETCTGTYTTTQTDVDTGSVTNTATATGTDPSNAPVTSNQSMATVPATTSASISIDKTTNGSDGLNIPVGAAVTWAYRSPTAERDPHPRDGHRQPGGGIGHQLRRRLQRDPLAGARGDRHLHGHRDRRRWHLRQHRHRHRYHADQRERPGQRRQRILRRTGSIGHQDRQSHPHPHLRLVGGQERPIRRSSSSSPGARPLQNSR